jgi:D-beta-D-heptose 7-phosphate kinase/D-beta-D-heptose 1-phosphate adenosyltransferase
MPTIAISGGFDPIHIGHINMLRHARELAGREGILVVIVNNDAWLMAKKGFVHMPEQERVRIVQAFAGVDHVVLTRHTENDPDRSVCHILEELRPDIFANGGDRKPDGDPVPEVLLCEKLGIEMLYNVGKDEEIDGVSKPQSSTDLVRNLALHVGTFERFEKLKQTGKLV